MRKHNLFRWVLVLLMAVTAVGISNTVFAQGDDPVDPEDSLLVEIEGEVAFEDGDLTVGGVIVAPAGAFNPSELEEGEWVIVEGYLLNDDTIQAVSLSYPDELEEECDPEVEECDVEEPVECDPEVEECDVEEPVVEEPVEEEDAGGCYRDDHPVVLAAVEEFGEDLADYDTLMTLHCEGNGLGNIIKAAQYASLAELSFEDVWAQYEDAGNWGQLKKELDINPSELAPGHAIGKGHKDKDQDQDMDQTMEQTGPGNSGNAHGNSANAPGKNKSKDKSNNGRGKKN